MVFGAQLSQISIESAVDLAIDPAAPKYVEVNWLEILAKNPEAWERVQSIRQELPRLMWQAAGICREKTSLETAIDRVKLLELEFNNLPISQLITQLIPPQSLILPAQISERDLCLWGETRNLLDISRAILTGALMRTESRGGHYRTDFPAIDPTWQLHTLVAGDCWSKSNSAILTSQMI